MSIVARNVTRLYGEQKALDDVSFQIKTGEIVGFLGPNGAGKSTMMKIITGFIPPTSGFVEVDGLDVGTSSTEVKKKIGYLPENNPLYTEMYVREYLSFVASFYKSDRPRYELVREIIEMTGLGPEQKKKIGSLSKGYRQRVGLAQALIHNPEVLILDEATTGLDPNQIVEIRNLIRDAGKHKTVMLSTHIMQEVEAICNRVIIIDKGVIVADEEKDKIYSMIGTTMQIIQVEFDKTVTPEQLKAIPGAGAVTALSGSAWEITANSKDDIRPLIFAFAVNNNLTVLSLQKKESNLEEIFRQLTGG
jgi:ABC-2 type transport system ATP-binding protein